MNYQDMKTKLQSKYKEWIEQIQTNCPKFLEKDRYSNPYYVGVQANWCDRATVKVLVVGEEGTFYPGQTGNAKVPSDCKEKVVSFQVDDYVNLMDWASDNLDRQLDLALAEDAVSKKYGFGYNPHSFWRWFRELQETAQKRNLRVSFAITELDKICKQPKEKGSCCLTRKEETRLHMAENESRIAILKEEIDILQPDIVLFFGWYSGALKMELPEIAKEVEGRRSEWDFKRNDKAHPIKFENDKRTYIFSYHPSRMTNEYKNQVIGIYESELEEFLRLPF